MVWTHLCCAGGPDNRRGLGDAIWQLVLDMTVHTVGLRGAPCFAATLLLHARFHPERVRLDHFFLFPRYRVLRKKSPLKKQVPARHAGRHCTTQAGDAERKSTCRGPLEMIVLEAQKGTIENCKIKAPRSFLISLVPLPPFSMLAWHPFSSSTPSVQSSN